MCESAGFHFSWHVVCCVYQREYYLEIRFFSFFFIAYCSIGAETGGRRLLYSVHDVDIRGGFGSDVCTPITRAEKVSSILHIF